MSEGGALLFTPGETFPLTGAGQVRQNAAGRKVGLGCIVGAALFAAFWGGVYLPLLFQSPHSFTVCGRGGCQSIPPGDYFSTIEAYTVLILGIASLFGFLGLRLRFGAVPTQLRVDGTGFSIVYGARKTRRVAWSSPRFDCHITDYRATFRNHPPEIARTPGPLCLGTGLTYVYPDEAAIQAVLDSARGAGVRIQEVHGGGRNYPETIIYTFFPPPIQ